MLISSAFLRFSVKRIIDAGDFTSASQAAHPLNRDAENALSFGLGGIGELECFGGIMKMRESFEALSAWFPLPGPVETLADN